MLKWSDSGILTQKFFILIFAFLIYYESVGESDGAGVGVGVFDGHSFDNFFAAGVVAWSKIWYNAAVCDSVFVGGASGCFLGSEKNNFAVSWKKVAER